MHRWWRWCGLRCSLDFAFTKTTFELDDRTLWTNDLDIWLPASLMILTTLWKQSGALWHCKIRQGAQFFVGTWISQCFYQADPLQLYQHCSPELELACFHDLEQVHLLNATNWAGERFYCASVWMTQLHSWYWRRLELLGADSSVPIEQLVFVSVILAFCAGCNTQDSQGCCE